jgi:DNA polymerase V
MSRGGKRKGAGRPKGQGKYGEPTTAVRVPESMVEEILAYARCKGYAMPFYDSKISAGFPSPADDAVDRKLDLNSYLIKHPTATFFLRVSGDSMINAGIFDNDILIVDRSLEAKHGRIVIAALAGELTVKRLYKRGDLIRLLPENPRYQPITISEDEELHIWGVVTNVLHSLS